MRWYERSMPQIKSILTPIKDVALEMSKLKGINSIFLWGSVAKNISKPNFHVKDIDLLIKCKFNHKDLLAIDSGNDSPFKMSHKCLKEMGFDTDSVDFTKFIKKIAYKNFDSWIISKDNNLLHWGYTTETADEWNELKKQAEDFTVHSTGIKINDINKCSEISRKNWKEIFDENIQYIMYKCPIGWYKSKETINDKILSETIKLWPLK